MGTPTPENKKRNDEIMKHYKAGKNFPQIAKLYKITPQAVGAIVRRRLKKLKK